MDKRRISKWALLLFIKIGIADKFDISFEQKRINTLANSELLQRTDKQKYLTDNEVKTIKKMWIYR